jgi:hypothetical protein
MKKNVVKLICTLVVLVTMVLPTAAPANQKQPITFMKQSETTYNPQTNHTVIRPLAVTDFDPLDATINVTVSINEIRALKTIDLLSDPDFYVKVIINGLEFVSDVWENMKYVEQPNWSASCEVPKDKEFVNITIELWDSNKGGDRLCDISPGNGDSTQDLTAELTYSIATGIWWGDDYLRDPSGYGRLNGCDDGSIYLQDKDCELWFDITQTDYDGDGLPFWVEINRYNTSPLIDNRGEDADQDGLPIEYEHKYGCMYNESNQETNGYTWIYDPFIWEDHIALDPDNDGLNNIEEYKTSQWGSDPFRKDLFIELDQMEKGPAGQGSLVPTESFDLIRDSYAKHNIVWHIDDGRLGGGELIPFKNIIQFEDLTSWYWDYFMHQDANNWRRGVFHWAVVSYHGIFVSGFTFRSEINGTTATDCFIISSKYMDSRVKHIPLIDSIVRKTFNKEKQRAIVYAGVIMHETGHSLDVRAPGCDNHRAMWPWQIGYWQYSSYKSVMNYRYVYNGLIDYSDGSHGKNDYDDWGTIDLTYFNPETQQ